MKQKVAIFLLITVLLTGCQPAVGETTPSSLPAADSIPEETSLIAGDSPTTTPTESLQPQYQQQPMVAVSMPVATEYFYADDGTMIFYHSYQPMQLITQDPEIANRCILDYLGRLDTAMDSVEQCYSLAVQDYSPGQPFAPYFYQNHYSATRVDAGVLSLLGSIQSYSSEPSIPVCCAANYNMLTGEVLTLGSILQHLDAKAQLIDLVIEQASYIYDDTQLYDDYADCIRERFHQDESFDEGWYFTGTGLCFFFSPYEIAPYISGTITLEVPYEKLTGIIDDAFFPPELEPMAGTLQADFLENTGTESFTQIAEVILDPEGEQFLLHVDGGIQEVRIAFGSWDETATVFTADATVFATPVLTSADAIMLQATIPDTMPNLRITYISGDTTNVVYLSQSGQDGSVILLD